MLLDVVGIDFGNVAEQVAAGVEGVFAHAAHLGGESRIAVFFLGKAHIDLGTDLLEEGECPESYGLAVFSVVLHLAPHERVGDAERRC